MKDILSKRNIIIVLCILGVLVVGVLLRNRYEAMKNLPENQAKTQVENKVKYLQNISKMITVPEEDPTMFEIKDVNVLKGQSAFFKDAQNGDVLFIFAKSAKALVYRPATNFLVNVGPVNYDPRLSQPTSQTSQQQIKDDNKKDTKETQTNKTKK